MAWPLFSVLVLEVLSDQHSDHCTDLESKGIAASLDIDVARMVAEVLG